ncbi:hypothetical protein L1275_000091 [Flavobacterium sp. HSC-61S13]|nr:hypothetical protein [Flavobacterium sp. HSC-61S13]
MIYNILLYVTLLAGFIPLILFIGKGLYKKKNYGSIFPLILLIACSSIYEYLGSVVLHLNVIPWFQIHSLLEFLALFYLFKNLIENRPRWFFATYLGLFLLFYIDSFFLLETESALVSKSLNKLFMTLFVISCSFLWVKQILDQKVILKLHQNGSFYIVIGLFFYYSTTISLFILSNYLYKNELFFNDYWLVNIISSLILRILLSIGVWKMN